MENAVRRADRLMYQAKGRKNAVTVELPENALTAQEELVGINWNTYPHMIPCAVFAGYPDMHIIHTIIRKAK